MRKILLIALGVLLVAGLPAVALAAWSTSSTVNNPICTETNDQANPQIASDGAGGAVITWQDKRNVAITSWDIYAQRVDSGGNAMWTANGAAICTADDQQTNPQIVSDGAGGAVITWYDLRSGTNYDIYAQRVDSDGNTMWTANGTAICTELDDQTYPQIASDGAGGAVITWHDKRNVAITSWDIYAQRVDLYGDTLWTANGTAISTAGNAQDLPQLVSDGAGGAVITWEDYRIGAADIYAQRVDLDGDTMWTANGTAICTEAGGSQTFPQIASDEASGAVITWHDNRNVAITSWDVYAQRVDSDGNTIWTANGTAISTALDDQTYPQIASDGAEGAVITWTDIRSGTYFDVYAQRVDLDGDTMWTANGTAICTALSNQNDPQLVSDGAEGAVITWTDNRGTNFDIYAQRVDSGGNAMWTDNGTAISTALDDQHGSQLVSDGAGSAVITWEDYRSGTNFDVYAQWVDASGVLGSPAAPPPTITDTGGASFIDIKLNLLGTEVSVLGTKSGKTAEDINITSEDGLLSITIPKYTEITDEDGDGIYSLKVETGDTPPPPPEGRNIIGLTYNFKPSGAAFDPPITVTFEYDPEDLPQGVAEDELVIAYYDEEAGEWMECECTCDAERNCIHASVYHFTSFALVSPGPPPAPAAFSVSDLLIQPKEAEAGEEVNITVTVANTGGMEGTYTAVLEINGAKEETQELEITAGGTVKADFTVSREEPGDYAVEVSGLEGSFTVTLPPAPPPAPALAPPVTPPPAVAEEGGVNWYITGTVLGVLALLAIFLPIWIRKRRAG